MAGYSGTPLTKKLGIGNDARVSLVNAPPGFAKQLDPLAPGARILRQTRAPMDVILCFTKSAADLQRRIAPLAKVLAPAGGQWIAWPKQSSGVTTDLSFDVVQKAGLPLGLVDNKICAVDETWSGLRFVIRKKDRR